MVYLGIKLCLMAICVALLRIGFALDRIADKL